MKIALITGSSGLVGSESVEFFIKKKFMVIGIDNDLRKFFFGKSASTNWVKSFLEKKYNKNYKHFNSDITKVDEIEKIFKKYKKKIKVVIHSAAQPSHDWAASNPQLDFNVNAIGTLNMLNLTKTECSLIQISTSAGGTQTFDLPPSLKRQTGPEKARKDSYSALILGNWMIKLYYDMMNVKTQNVNYTFTPMFIN